MVTALKCHSTKGVRQMLSHGLPSFVGYGGAGGLVPGGVAGGGLGAGERHRHLPSAVTNVCVWFMLRRVPQSAMGISFLETYPEILQAFEGFWDRLLVHMLSWFPIV